MLSNAFFLFSKIQHVKLRVSQGTYKSYKKLCGLLIFFSPDVEETRVSWWRVLTVYSLILRCYDIINGYSP